MFPEQENNIFDCKGVAVYCQILSVFADNMKSQKLWLRSNKLPYFPSWKFCDIWHFQRHGEFKIDVALNIC